MNLKFQISPHLSRQYMESVALRYLVLRKPLGLDFSKEQLIAEDTDFHLAVYDDKEGLLACLILTPITKEIIKMRQVAVHPKLQGKGVGTALVKFSEQFSKENNYSEISLHARDTAVPFYLRMDYEIYDAPFEEVGIPHRKMRKFI
ncbi:MAG: GNAT family N-acetyltransferase [Bacteroidetes bacterium]|nr:GNAT family N-acetyltransferase [Bacteroidota bacterium]